MKICLFSLGCLLLILDLSAQQIVVNDAFAETRALSGGFNKMVVSGGIELYLSQLDKESIAVSASKEQNLQYIRTEISNNELRIYYVGPRKRLDGSNKIKVYVSFTKLESLRSSGACMIKVADVINVPDFLLDMSSASDFKGTVNVKNLSIQLSGASMAKLSGSATELTVLCSGASDFKGSFTVKNLSIQLSGASQAKLSGSATKLAVLCTGASDLNAFELSADDCNATASGASDINISVKKDLSIIATGASTVYYKGTAQVKKNRLAGASKVALKD